MIEFQINLITGMMLGIEFPPLMEINEDIQFCVVVDLFIVRFTLVKWRKEEE